MSAELQIKCMDTEKKEQYCGSPVAMQTTSLDNLDSLIKILLISFLSPLPSFVILTLPALTQAVSIITVII